MQGPFEHHERVQARDLRGQRFRVDAGPQFVRACQVAQVMHFQERAVTLQGRERCVVRDRGREHPAQETRRRAGTVVVHLRQVQEHLRARGNRA